MKVIKLNEVRVIEDSQLDSYKENGWCEFKELKIKKKDSESKK